jgi:hypothetical protein
MGIEGRSTQEQGSEKNTDGAWMQQMGSQLMHGMSHACDACETNQRNEDDAGMGNTSPGSERIRTRWKENKSIGIEGINHVVEIWLGIREILVDFVRKL